MAKRKRKSYRIASPAIYKSSEAAQRMRPEMRDALAGEAFEMSDALRYPSAGVRAELSGRARFPTDAKYWTRHSEKRLRSSTPLKGESKAGAKRRAAKARSFFAREAERERRATSKPQWRVAMTGTVELSGAGGHIESFSGVQYGPWRAVPAGGLTDARIMEAYREVARYSVSVNARGRPEFGELTSRGFSEYRARGTSQNAILYVEHAEIETRDAPIDAEDEA